MPCFAHALRAAEPNCPLVCVTVYIAVPGRLAFRTVDGSLQTACFLLVCQQGKELMYSTRNFFPHLHMYRPKQQRTIRCKALRCLAVFGHSPVLVDLAALPSPDVFQSTIVSSVHFSSVRISLERHSQQLIICAYAKSG